MQEKCDPEADEECRTTSQRGKNDADLSSLPGAMPNWCFDFLDDKQNSSGHLGDEEANGDRVRTLDFDPAHENHYVFVLHGTFDAPPPDGSATWYFPAPEGETNFCSKIAKLLDRTKIGGKAVWRELPCEAPNHIPYPFHWDGMNTHQGRIDAAIRLSKLVRSISRRDPAARIHLIAHSHGGNVLLKTVHLTMRHLARYRFKKLHPAIRRKFWETYRCSYDAIRQWRPVEGLKDSLWRFFPFLVVWRSFDGSVAPACMMELYPFASQRWFDSLLCLPSHRQRLFLRNRFASSPITNPLGSLVFLGTPFYVKQWERYGKPLLALTVLFSVALAAVVMLFYVFFWEWLALTIAHKNPTFLEEYGILAGVTGGVMIFIIVSIVIEVVRTAVFYSGNIYLAPKFDWSPAMSALVIHAGKLDEANIALSTEPIVRAYIFPHLIALLNQNPWRSFPKAPLIYAGKRAWLAFVYSYLMVLAWDFIFFIPAILMAIGSRIISPIVTATLHKLVVTLSFGLNQGELSFAYVYVDERLDLQVHAPNIEHWNVQKLLAEAKTRSLQGELMPGYEDHTLEPRELLSPRSSAARTQRTFDDGEEEGKQEDKGRAWGKDFRSQTLSRLQSIKNIPGGIKNIPAGIKNIPANIKNIPAHVRNIPELVGDNLKRIEVRVGGNMKKIPGNMKNFPENIKRINHRMMATAASIKIQEPALSPLLLQGSSVRRRIPLRRSGRPRILGSSSLTHSEDSVDVHPSTHLIPRHKTVGSMEHVGGKDLLSDARQLIERQSSLDADSEQASMRSMVRGSALQSRRDADSTGGGGSRRIINPQGSVGSPSVGASVAGSSRRSAVQFSEAESSVLGPGRSAPVTPTPGCAATPVSGRSRGREVPTGALPRFGSFGAVTRFSTGDEGGGGGEVLDGWRSLVLSVKDDENGQVGGSIVLEEPLGDHSHLPAMIAGRAGGPNGEIDGQMGSVEGKTMVQVDAPLKRNYKEEVHEDNERLEDDTDEEEEGENHLVYEFLWNDWELKKRVEQSATFPLLEKQIRSMGQNPRLSEAEFRRQVMQLCVLLEERLDELTGRFDLNHGAYFRDPRILKVIAYYIGKRKLPEWSRELDGDLERDMRLSKVDSFTPSDGTVANVAYS